MKLKVYLAGKISKNDWRHDLVPNLKGHLWPDGAIDTGSFSYTGPFFVSCDHACFHQPRLHGAVSKGISAECGEHKFSSTDVVEFNTQSLVVADLVFVYVTATDCHGTLIEIGMAKAMGKRIVLAINPEVKDEEIWYAKEMASHVYLKVITEQLPALFLQVVLSETLSICTRRGAK